MVNPLIGAIIPTAPSWRFTKMSDQFKADIQVPETTTAEPPSAPATIHYPPPTNELPASPPGGALAIQAPTEASDASPRIEAPAAASVKTMAEPGPAVSLTIPEVHGQALVTVPSPAHTELLRIGDRISSRCGRAFRVLFQNPPCILGQAIADYYELAVVALDEFIPQNYREVALLKQIVDEEWKVLTFSQVQTALLNAAIAAGLVERLCDSGGDKKDQLRQWRRVVFAAGSGNVEMRAHVAARTAVLSIITGGGKRVEILAHADPLYQHLVVTAERKFWRCVESGETPQLFGVDPPKPRVDAIRIVDMSTSNAWAGFAAVFAETRSAYLEHERAKSELKGLMPEDVKEAIGHGIRGKRSKSGAVSFDLLKGEEGSSHAAV
jgi:hypothetical protein